MKDIIKFMYRQIEEGLRFLKVKIIKYVEVKE